MNNINFFKKSSMKLLVLNSLFLFFILSLPLHKSFAENNLSSLQKEIKQSRALQAQQNQQRQALEESIAASEQEVAKAVLQAQETEQAIAAEREHFQNLKKQTDILNEDKVKQQKLLEQQLISAYMAGRNDLIKLLLNQEDLSKIVRAKSYYFYLNKARLESIEALQKTQQQLEKNTEDLNNSLLALETMYKQQKTNSEKLLTQRAMRNKALNELQQDLNYQKARLAQLSETEAKLKTKLHKQRQARQERELAAAKAQARQKITPKKDDQRHSSIAKQKGQLNWPLHGKVVATFGSKRSSQVKWKGIAIAANEGEKVRAVATGRVLFSGYFKGYGMVIALDHSDDYITLYGYNQALLHQTGDIVFQGDAIALAGHSGGQDKNGLYFELSHKGKAQDPMKWLKKRSRY